MFSSKVASDGHMGVRHERQRIEVLARRQGRETCLEPAKDDLAHPVPLMGDSVTRVGLECSLEARFSPLPVPQAEAAGLNSYNRI
jgi:hypothetical protein